MSRASFFSQTLTAEPKLQFLLEKPYRLKCFKDVYRWTNYLTSVSCSMSWSFNHMLQILQNKCNTPPQKNLFVRGSLQLLCLIFWGFLAQQHVTTP